MAGVMAPRLWPTLACGVQQVSTVPIRSIPGGRVSGRRASARPRRVSPAKRSRHVAVRRAMEDVWLTPAPGDRRRRVATRAAGPAISRGGSRTVARIARP
jgi:hypothetical protein